MRGTGACEELGEEVRETRVLKGAILRFMDGEREEQADEEGRSGIRMPTC